MTDVSNVNLPDSPAVQRQLVDSLMQDHRPFHSDFQIDHFIVGRAGTPWGRYQQCLREIATRVDAINEDEYAIRRIELKAERANGNKVVYLRHRLERLHETLRDRRRELRRFTALAAALKAGLGVVDEERRAQLDADLWYQRLRMMAARDLIMHGRVSEGTMDLCLSCPVEMRVALVNELQSEDGKAALKQDAMTEGPALIEATT